MKKFRKIMAVLVAAMMIMATMVPAFAATVDITIKQTNAVNQDGVGAEEYSLYKIFDAKKISASTGDTDDDSVTTDSNGADMNYTYVGIANDESEWTSLKTAQSNADFYLKDDATKKYTKVTAYSDAAVKGKKLYKLDPDKGIVYTIDSVNNKWYKVLTECSGQNWVDLTPTTVEGIYNVTWKPGMDQSIASTRDFAKWLWKNKDSSTAGTISRDKNATTNTTTKEATASDVDSGYWLISSTLGTELVLATSSIEITTKNSHPTTTKTAAKTNYNIGDFVKYTINVELPASTDFTKPVIVHDTMAGSLRLITSADTTYGSTYPITVKCGEDNVTYYLLEEGSDSFDTAYSTLSTTLGLSGANVLAHNSTMHALDSNKNEYDFYLNVTTLAPAANAEPEAKTVVITYYAEVMGESGINTPINNQDFVEYSKYKSNPGTYDVKTFGFQIQKDFETSGTNGDFEATFNISETVVTANNASGKYYKKTDGTYTMTAPTGTSTSDITAEGYEMDGDTVLRFDLRKGTALSFTQEDSAVATYHKSDSNDAAGKKGTAITTKDDVVTSVQGLAAGTYTITETATADGFMLLNSDIIIQIDETGLAKLVSNPPEVSGIDGLIATNKISMENKTSTVLPATGGMGTTVLYIVGGMLVILAGAYLFFSRKRTA